MKLLFVTSLLILLTACGGTPTKTHYYLLRADTEQQGSHALSNDGIYLATVHIASYLDQNGLVLETSDGQTNPAHYHVWSEPLRDSLKGFFAEEISKSANKSVHIDRQISERKTRLDITIDQLHGTNNGQALIAAHWTVTTDNDQHSKKSFRFNRTTALEASGYPALVSAEKKLLIQLAEAIAKHLPSAQQPQ